ncbi:MAG TPA: sulfatase-like hydrolase/transferase [Polyangiaceae bacterium]
MLSRGALSIALLLTACKADPPQSSPDTAPSAPSPAEGARPAAEERTDLLSRIGACDVEHRGLLLDLGTEAAGARRRFSIDPEPEGSSVDREGATFERVQKRELTFDVWLDEPVARPSLSLRVHGGAARVVYLSVNDVRFGALRLPGNETRILSTGAAAAPLPRGRHRILLRFTGAPRGAKVLADLDWLRLGEHDERPTSHAAPTREDIIANIVLDRVPKQSLVLRAPSTIRCWLRPGPDARMKLALGLWGTGSGVAEVRLVRDGERPVVLQTRKVTGGDRATWTPVSIDLGDYAGSVVGLELSAKDTNRAGRIAFGDPAIVRRRAGTPPRPEARIAVVVVLAAADRRRMPPWGPTGNLRTLGELARASVAFSSHRSPTTAAGAVVATLLTGLPPRAHGLEDGNSRLAQELHTLPEIVKEASGQTAMFTGSPTTFTPFGFDQGFDIFDPISPVKDLPAGEPLARAARWLDQEFDPDRNVPVFVVVHARGGHPPWDVSREDAQHLKPAEYSGLIDPRRGGVILGALRERRSRGKRLLEDDWTRIHALSDASLARQDAALGQLVQVLKRKGVWDQTLLVITSDVAPGDPPELPFDPVGPLTEDRLLTPLLVKFPGQRLGGKDVPHPSSVEDLSFTLLGALGLKPSTALAGLDLYARALGHAPLLGRPQIATLPGYYATRLGQRLLRGNIGAVPTLCAFDVDPACAADVFDQELIAARALWQATFVAEGAARKLTPPDASRRPVTLDDETAAALVVWGDQPH